MSALMSMLICLVAFSDAPREQQDKPFRLLFVGESLARSDSEVETGQAWLGLYKEWDGFSLLYTRISRYQFWADGMDGETSWQNIQTPDVSKPPMFLVKGPGLREKDSIPTVSSPVRDLNIGEYSFSLEGQELRLVVMEDWSDDSPRPVYTITASSSNHPGIDQVIERVGHCDDVAKIMWMGDLDGDGLIDLLLRGASIPYGDGGGEPALYLSSARQKGELMHLVDSVSFSDGC